VFIPLYEISWIFLVCQIIILGICLKQAFKIFSSWNAKKRRYDILIQQNSNVFTPDSFTEYMQAPCGRILVKIVLKDLNKSNEYNNLLALKQPILQVLKTSCKPSKTILYINND